MSGSFDSLQLKQGIERLDIFGRSLADGPIYCSLHIKLSKFDLCKTHTSLSPMGIHSSQTTERITVESDYCPPETTDYRVRGHPMPPKNRSRILPAALANLRS